MPYTYEYPRPSLTLDCVVFAWTDSGLEVLLIERAQEPFANKWALPGGFLEMDEELDEGARRELEEETGLGDMFLEQLYTFGTVGRDPRGRVITVAYYALIDKKRYADAKGASDARDARWFPLEEVPELAFDHAEILVAARERLRGKVRYAPLGFELLPEKFTLSELQNLYETILGEKMDKRNFRKKLKSMDILLELDEKVNDPPYRGAKLYKFDEVKYKALEKKGNQFKL